MNVLSLAMIFIVFTTIKVLILNDNDIEIPEIPNFPQFGAVEFITIGECDEILLCLNVVGDALYNVAVAVINIFAFIFDLLIFFVEALTILIVILITFPEKTPWYVQTISLTPIYLFVALLVYQLFRTGDSSADE